MTRFKALDDQIRFFLNQTATSIASALTSRIDCKSLREALEMLKRVTLGELLRDTFKELLGLQLGEVIGERFQRLRKTLCSFNDNLLGE